MSPWFYFSAPSSCSAGGPGDFADQAALTLPLRHGVRLLWDKWAVLEIRSAIGNNDIDKLLSDAHLVGRTGDVVRCAASGASDMRCLPSHLNQHGLVQIARLNRTGQPRAMHFALDQQSGLVATRDYRGQQVVAAYGAMADTGLGMVVKQDAIELYQPIRRQFETMLTILAILFALALGLLRWQLLPLVTALLQARRADASWWTERIHPRPRTRRRRNRCRDQ